MDHQERVTLLTQPLMPQEETAHLKEAYANARVILEYGSGGSTMVAAQSSGKFIMSVESDLTWARALRRNLAGALSPVIIQHVNIGPVGPWGRPISHDSWKHFHAYPNSIWGQSWFRQPDVVLIDGRFRTACLAAVMFHTQRSVRVLFDDYAVRDTYRLVERLIKPTQIIGRMAEFTVLPNAISQSDLGFLIEQFFQATIHGESEEVYRLPASQA